MIQYTLVCAAQHGFEAWFRNADAYEDQAARGILVCPVCGSREVAKALMAPAVSRAGEPEKVSFAAGHPDRVRIVQAMRALKDTLTENADYVGERFAEEARKIHYSEVEPRGIYGEATRDEVAGLADEGIAFMPLPLLPDEQN